jgi:tRNA uridine 5-carbamoylmethylation protein Kti12
MNLGKIILVTGPASTGKTILANQLKLLMENFGQSVEVLDDVPPDFSVSACRSEAEGKTVIVTTNTCLPSWRRASDAVIDLNNSAFVDVLSMLQLLAEDKA